MALLTFTAAGLAPTVAALQAAASQPTGPVGVVPGVAEVPAVTPAATASVTVSPTPPPPAVTTAAATTTAAPRPASAPVWGKPLQNMGCFAPNGSREFGVDRGSHMHGGIDLGTPVGAHYGDPVLAIHAGRAHWGSQPSGAGTYVWVDHGDGTSSWYFHLLARKVADGATVKAGQIIGTVGESGNATVPHLHLETHVGSTRVDPVRFLADRGIRIRC